MENSGLPFSGAGSLMEALARLLRLLAPGERSRLRRVVFFAAGAGLLEMLAVLSVLPFMALVADPTVITEYPWAERVASDLGLSGTRDILLVSGAGVLGLLVAANLAGALSVRMVHLTIGNIIHSLSRRLLSTYLSQPYEWFLQRHSSRLNRNLLEETRMAIQWALLPLLNSAVRGIGALFLVILLLVVDPRLTLVAGGILGLAYVGIYFSVRAIQDYLGRIRLEAEQQRMQIATEAMGGIKELKSLGVEKEFVRRFEETGPPFVRANAWGRVVTEVPRNILEVLAIGTVLGILIFLLLSGSPLDDALPVLALFALAGYKLVPSFQLVFSGFTAARLHIAAVRDIEADLAAAEGSGGVGENGVASPVSIREEFELSDITYQYPEAPYPALDGFCLRVSQGERIGVVGPTGAGKTTLADLLLGLLRPKEGELRVDGEPIGTDGWAQWRASVGYVPQSIFLSDDTVQANIAFGIPPDSVDQGRVLEVARMAEIFEYVSGLPDGFQTRVGERGVRLSGGQRQRIGIARALYGDPAVLLLDEATSALDGATEDAVMDAVFGLERERTIVIIAHRLGTVRRCDRIIVLEGGGISAMGDWETLTETSELFRVLSRLEDPERARGKEGVPEVGPVSRRSPDS